MRGRSLLAQVLAVNALLLGGAMLLSVIAARGYEDRLVIVAGLLATVAGTALLLRRRFVPLDQLASAMERVDLGRPQGNATVAGAAGSREVTRLTNAFNRMLTRLEIERRQSGQAAVRAQERERARIARDLHDEVNQALTAILLRVEASLQRAPDELREELQETKRLATLAMEELLQIARRLRPTVLDDHGLVAALHTQVRDFAEQTGLRAELRTRGTVPRLTTEQQLAIYRVTQEGLSNVAQHAHATAVDVELSFVGRTTLTISDDGSGFSRGRDGGLGLSGMRERALLAGGRLRVWSEQGNGSRVELVIDPPARDPAAPANAPGSPPPRVLA